MGQHGTPRDAQGLRASPTCEHQPVPVDQEGLGARQWNRGSQGLSEGARSNCATQPVLVPHVNARQIGFDRRVQRWNLAGGLLSWAPPGDLSWHQLGTDGALPIARLGREALLKIRTERGVASPVLLSRDDPAARSSHPSASRGRRRPIGHVACLVARACDKDRPISTSSRWSAAWSRRSPASSPAYAAGRGRPRLVRRT